ncbi:unnamed protein product, partial [Laminaria digitata]
QHRATEGATNRRSVFFGASRPLLASICCFIVVWRRSVKGSNRDFRASLTPTSPYIVRKRRGTWEASASARQTDTHRPPSPPATASNPKALRTCYHLRGNHHKQNTRKKTEINKQNKNRKQIRKKTKEKR